jgi:hypothetical protein
MFEQRPRVRAEQFLNPFERRAFAPEFGSHRDSLLLKVNKKFCERLFESRTGGNYTTPGRQQSRARVRAAVGDGGRFTLQARGARTS